MVMIMVVMIVVVIMMVIVVMVMTMVMTVAFLTVLVMMVVVVMVVVVTAGALVLVDMEVYTGILHCMHHGVLQIALVHIHDGSHEVEIRFLGGFQALMVFHTDVQIGKIECDSFSVDGNGHLDVTHQITRFLLDPSADLHHHGIQPCLSISVETVNMSGETDTDTACKFFGIDHQITSNTSFTPSPVVAHMGMTFTPGNSELSHSVISSIFSGDVRSFLFIAMISEPESCLM